VRLVALLTVCWASLSAAATYDLPLPGGDLVGEVYGVTVAPGQTLLDVARLHGIGQEAMVHANPGVDRWLPAPGTEVTVPAAHLLPDAPREGLVLNLPEMRLYRYPPPQPDGTRTVVTYPVSVGRMDWRTPLGRTEVVGKRKDPAWHPPQSVRQEAIARGDPPPPARVPPGPDNPLGEYALRLGLPGYLIHGTNKPWGVGMRVTHGCVRLLPEHIAELFAQVPVGTPVYLVDQPVKVGWHGTTLYLEVHPPLEEDTRTGGDLLRYALEHVYAELEARPAKLDGSAVRRAVTEMRGTPVPISLGEGVRIDNPLFRR
jgi:L,D-transpeptidase ErfK/SrfK